MMIILTVDIGFYESQIKKKVRKCHRQRLPDTSHYKNMSIQYIIFLFLLKTLIVGRTA